MKISSGGVGTVASAQAFNAKSAFPYQWAWNAIGETFQTQATSDATKGIQWWGNPNNIASAAAHAEGVKIIHDGSGNHCYAELFDDVAVGVSGALNVADTSVGRYVHLFFNFSDHGEGSATDSVSGANATGGSNVMYWYPLNDGGSTYGGSNLHTKYTLGTTTVFVYDMNIIDDQANLGSITWQSMGTYAPGPIAIEFYLRAVVGSSFVWKGAIITERILSPGEISLPVDISKARS